MPATIKKGEDAMRRAMAFAAAVFSACVAEAAAAGIEVRAAVLRVERPVTAPLSRLDETAGDEGFAGARIGAKDNATTGGFLGHAYTTAEVTTDPAGAVAALDALLADGVRYVVTIAAADDLLALADHAKGREALLMNVSASDDRLRGEDCRANVLHVTPSRAMIADGLAQYLVWKRWTDWVLIEGSNPEDRLKAAAYRRAAEKFGARIVEARTFEDTGGARRSDSGHVQVQRQVPVFTQRLPEHHVVVAADETHVFAAFLPYRTWDARPVAGDAGLVARAWHPALEAFGATQLQRRFEAQTGRRMTDLDYEAWTALRALGEAVTRTKSAEVGAVRDFLLSDAFTLAAFKGQPLSFRPWDNQLRQAIVLSDEKTVVSLSPQEEFLHERTKLDTLGVDEPETACRF
jgi:ABC transporter substrate binding protein (PQQ-dependent alcohol dehydrogenase system)